VPLRIDYVSEGFQVSAPVANGPATLSTTWDELLESALTVGRPNRQYVFQYGQPSVYEALFRLSLVRMALEQSSPNATRLSRTTAARTLDPSEKGAINYFLGLAICKLFADKLLNVPWLLHLDVFRPMLNPVLTGRSRPDLVGQSTNGNWVVLECKGRISTPTSDAKNKAKLQAQRLVSVNGASPAMHVGGIAHFRNDVFQFYWRDPAADGQGVRSPIELQVEPRHWSYHYRPALDLILSSAEYRERMLNEPVLMPVSGADVNVGIHPTVFRALREGEWETARHVSQGLPDTGIPYREDGIAVVAGESWLRPFEETEGIAGI
jgi:hypothetical protein